MFFHTMISSFISIILRYGKSGHGLFGTCLAYYGTVEAQARGTLHCHMLIWIKDHPSPQKMRDLMIADEDYQQKMFTWLESLIKSEPLGFTGAVHASSPSLGPPPSHSTQSNYTHPGVRRLPSIHTLLPGEFKTEYHNFVNDLVTHFNWHKHTETCWKYLRSSQPRIDANCRMRMNGSVHPHTSLDPESLSIQLRRLHPWIANYNDLVIFLLQANMDIKHIGSGEGAKALIFYITDYITKASIPAHLGLAALTYAISRTDTKYKDVSPWGAREETGALATVVNSMISRQEVSHPQVMSYLLGGGDHYTSHRYRILHYPSFERLLTRHFEPHIPITVTHASTAAPVQPRSLEPTSSDTASRANVSEQNSEEISSGLPRLGRLAADELASRIGDPDDVDDQTTTLTLTPGSISAQSQQQDYLLRPASEPFESMALYQYTGMTEKITNTSEVRRADRRQSSTQDGAGARGRPSEERGQFLSGHPQRNMHLVRKRVTWVVPVVLGSRIARGDRSPEERESWARQVLTLFVPWRTPNDLKQQRESWSEAYDRHAHRITSHHASIIHNMAVLSECKDARDRAVITLHHDRGSLTSGVAEIQSVEHPEQREASDDVPGQVHDHDPSSELCIRTRPQRTIDELISVPARVAVDRCVRMYVASGTTASYGVAKPMEDGDEHGVAIEQATMRKLKRKRRPSPPPPPTPPPQTTLPSLPHNIPARRTTPAVDVYQLEGSPHTIPSTSHINPNPSVGRDPNGLIRQVILEFQLQHNVEQLRAFEIVAHHACFGGSQLLMYVAGVGGTGKSYVLRAMLRLFELLGRRNEVLVSAPTGAAAILIGGYTVHSLLMLPDRQGADLQPLVVLWSGVFYLIIDEVSMISAQLLYDISTRLQHAKGNTGIAEDVPFGGVNVIFMGDFGQLRPVGGAPLYCHRLTKMYELGVRDTQSVDGVAGLKGVYLWRLVKKIVILRRNQRQSNDSSYAALLARVREGHCRSAREAGRADDYATLQTRLIQNFDPDTLERFSDAPIIVGVKSIRDPLNERILCHRARAIGADVHRYHSRDRVPHMTLDPATREFIWNMPTSKTKDSLGKLPLFPGMKVMVQENVAFACNVVNGAVGTVHDIKYTEEDGRRYVVVVYVNIPGAGKYFGPDHSDTIPIFPVTTTFKWVIAPKSANTREQSVWVNRLQPPLLPAYVYTDYKAQGRSLDFAIVDPESARSQQGVYVMLSRVRTLEGLAILHPFQVRKVEERVSEEIRTELERLEFEDGTTRRWYHRELCPRE